MMDSNDPRDALPPVPTDAAVSNASAAASVSLASLPLATPPPLSAAASDVPPRFLLIDDEADFLASVAVFHRHTELQHHAQLDTWLYRDGTEADLVAHVRQRLREKPGVDALVVGLNLRGGGGSGGGLDLIRRLREQCPELLYVPAVIMTASLDPDRQAAAFDQQVEDYIIKVGGGRVEAAEVIGGLLSHRLITDLPHWRLRAEERFWLDLNEEVSNRLARGEEIYSVCQVVGEQLECHLKVSGVYLRERADGLLRLRGGSDLLGIGRHPLREAEMPFIADLLGPKRVKLVSRFDCLTDALTGPGIGRSAVGLRAMVALLRTGGEPLGYIAIYRRADAMPFRRLDEGFVGMLAQRLGAALSSRRQVEALESRQGRLARALEQFARAEDEKDVFRDLANALHEALNQPAGFPPGKTTIRRLRPGTDELPLIVGPLGMNATKHADETVTLRDSEQWTVARAAAGGRTIRRGDITEATFGFKATADGIRSHLTVPIESQGVLVGVANLESPLSQAFTQGDEDFAQSLCASAADAMIRIRSQRFALGIATELDAVVTRPNQQSDALLAQAVRLLFEYTGYAELLYLVQAADEQLWEVQQVFGRRGERLSAARLEKWQLDLAENWGRSYTSMVIAAGPETAQYTTDASLLNEDRQARGAGQQTLAMAVLLLRPDVRQPATAALGLLFVHPSALSRAQLDMLDRFGRLLGALLERQLRLGQLLDENVIAQQNARMGQAFHFQRHAMRNKLVAIRNLALDLGKPDKDMQETRAKILERVSAADRDVARGRNLIKLPEARRVHLPDSWERLRVEFASLAEAGNCSILPGDFAVEDVWADPDVLESILELLIENTILHAGDGSGRTITVRASSRQQDGKVVITICDDGKGLARGVRGRLFEPGISTKPDSTGVGLYLSRARARELGGDLVHDVSARAGTTWMLHLPPVVRGNGS